MPPHSDPEVDPQVDQPTTLATPTIPVSKQLSFAGRARANNVPLLKKLEGRIDALEQLSGVDKAAHKALKATPKQLSALNTRIDALARQLNRMVSDYNAMLVELEREPIPDETANPNTPVTGDA